MDTKINIMFSSITIFSSVEIIFDRALESKGSVRDYEYCLTDDEEISEMSEEL